MNLLSKVLQAVLEASLPILVSALAAWIAAKAGEMFRKMKDTNPELGEILTNISKAAVNAAEQSIVGSGLGAEKREYAFSIVKKYLKAKGIDVDPDIIYAMIESEVRKMNLYEAFYYEAEEKPNGDLPPAIQE